MSALAKCVAALREIRDEGVTTLRACLLIDEALIAAESAPSEEAIRADERAKVEAEIVAFMRDEARFEKALGLLPTPFACGAWLLAESIARGEHR